VPIDASGELLGRLAHCNSYGPLTMGKRAAYARKLAESALLPFPVLTDLDLGYTLSIGLAIWAGPAFGGNLVTNWLLGYPSLDLT
jgi:hypothetical protein